MIQVRSSFVGDVSSDIKGLFFAYFLARSFISQKTIFDYVIATDSAFVFSWQVGTIFIDKWVVAMIGSENGMGH